MAAESIALETHTPEPGSDPDVARTHEAISRLAHVLWLERGAPQGSPDEDWFEAERLSR
jgi:hypothetical protein